MLQRWLYSTNAKDIAILYFVFALFSAIAGTAMSLIIRLELAGPGVQYINNNQTFNVLVTGHAILIIFFFVMPALIGGFGKKKLNNRLYNTNENSKLYYNKNKLGPYLAGLIEGDGTIYVPLKDLKLTNKPSISIAFNKDDEPLAIYLLNLLNIGKIYSKKDSTKVCIWQLQKIEDIYFIILLINGYFRTPKYEALIRLINWINNYIEINKNLDINLLKYKNNKLILYNINKKLNILSKISIIKIKELDKSNLNSNSWLAGFSDADSNFSIILYKDNKIKIYYRIEVRQKYHKEEINNYFEIIIKICKIFNSNLLTRERTIKLKNQIKEKTYYSYIIIVSGKDNILLVNNYFKTYSLLSSKYINFKDWSKLLLCINKYNTFKNPNTYKLAKEIKINFNLTRKYFNWDHLKNNYYLK